MAQRREGSPPMNGRLKLQVLNDKGRWRTAYVLITMLHENLIMLKAHGFKVRINGRPEQ